MLMFYNIYNIIFVSDGFWSHRCDLFAQKVKSQLMILH